MKYQENDFLDLSYNRWILYNKISILRIFLFYSRNRENK